MTTRNCLSVTPTSKAIRSTQVARRRGDCSCSTPPADLGRFLHTLHDDLLHELDRQVPSDDQDRASTKAADARRDRVKRIYSFLNSNRGHRLKLNQRGTPTKPPKLEKGRNYFIGLGPQPGWQAIAPNSPDGPDEPQICIAEFSRPFDLEVDFEWSIEVIALCFFPFYSFSGVFTENFRIDDGTTLFTDLSQLRFSGGLEMGTGAALYGLNPCGLRVVATQFRSTAGGAMSDWPIISTSIPSTDEQSVSLEEVPGQSGLYEVSGLSAIEPTGIRGDDASDAEAVIGNDGSPGFCGLSFQAAGNGQSMEEGVGGTAQSGQPGGPGTHARPLSIDFQTADGRIRIHAGGGDGGDGGKGGRGAYVSAGDGGDMPWVCAWAGAPGLGGTVVNGGHGGDGGSGGPGGDGSDIVLRLENSSPDFQYRACVKGGNGGQGGPGGEGGTSVGGNDGRFVGPPFQQFFQTRPSGSPGDDGATGAVGTRGGNGSITINGELVVEPNNGLSASDFRYPAGTVIGGVESNCWN